MTADGGFPSYPVPPLTADGGYAGVPNPYQADFGTLGIAPPPYRQVDPPISQVPGFGQPPAAAQAPQQGFPVPIPSMTDQTPHPQAPIEHVIARLGIHPSSGLAQAFRAIHTILTQHLAAQAGQVAHATHGAHPPLGMGRPGGPIHPGPILQ